MMGQQSGKQKPLFYAFNLDEHVLVDHLLRGIDRCLDLSARPTGFPRLPRSF